MVFRLKITRNALGSEKFSVKKNKFIDSKSVVSTACELFTANDCNKNNTSNKFKKLDCIFWDKAHLSENCKDTFSMRFESKKDIVKKKMLFCMFKKQPYEYPVQI